MSRALVAVQRDDDENASAVAFVSEPRLCPTSHLVFMR